MGLRSEVRATPNQRNRGSDLCPGQGKRADLPNSASEAVLAIAATVVCLSGATRVQFDIGRAGATTEPRELPTHRALIVGVPDGI